jgi:hypothetical protein
MRADPTTLFDDWAARVARGESPDPREYLERAGPGREELAQLMEAYLQAAPRREPDPETVELARTWLRGDSPLAELRARRGIRRQDVVAAIVDAFGLAPEKAGIVKSYYHRLEAGLLDPSRLSRPLLDLLGKTLGVANETILGWRTRSLEVAPAFRIQSDITFAPAAPPASPSQEPDDPEIGQLFLSGR